LKKKKHSAAKPKPAVMTPHKGVEFQAASNCQKKSLIIAADRDAIRPYSIAN